MYRTLTALLALWMALLAPSGVRAADYPAAPVKLVHAYPGGLVDVGARTLADLLSARWKQPVVVEGKPGASELLAGDAVAKAPKDGLTLLVGTEVPFANNLFLFNRLPFDPLADLEPLTELFEVRFGLVVRGDLPASTLAEFVALMKREGASRSYASSGNGGPLHLAMEGFRRAAGFEMLHVPYKTIAQVGQDLLGGRLDAVFISVPFALPFLASGKLKLLAVTGASRMKAAPAVPTFAEAGYPGIDDRTSIVLAAPRGVPPEVLRKLQADVAEVLASREFNDRFLAPNGLQSAGGSPKQVQDMLAGRRQAVQRLVKALGLQPE